MTTVSYNDIEQVQYQIEVVYPELLKLKDAWSPVSSVKDKQLNNKLVLSPLPQLFAEGQSCVNMMEDEVDDEFFERNIEETSLVHSFVQEEDSAKKESMRVVQTRDNNAN